jgi:ribokinase
MYDIITIGDAVIDTHVNIDNASVECDVDTRACRLCMDYASKIPITGSFQSLGGNAANVACGVARLGLDSAIVATIGHDANGRLIVEELKKNHVDTTFVARNDSAPTRYSVVLNFRGERTILSYHTKRKYSFPKKFPATQWIYYTSMSEGFETFEESLLEFLEAHPSVKLAYNPGSFQLKNSLPDVLNIIPRSELLIINLQEAERVANTTLKKEKTESALIHKLLNLGVREVVVTDAERGVIAGDEDEIWHMNIYPATVVSKTGAGDSFSAAYLAARQSDCDIHTALMWGTANSASVISSHGPQTGLLDRKKIKAAIDRFPKIKPIKLS